MTKMKPVSTLVQAATRVARHPLRTSLQAVGVAKGAATVGISLGQAAVRSVQTGQQGSREVWDPDLTETPGDPDDATAPGTRTPTPSPSAEPPEPRSDPEDRGRQAPWPEDREPERVLADPGARLAAEAAENLPPVTPGEPGEAFANEPSATSRVSVHSGTSQDEEIDAWDLDVQEAENTTVTPAEGIAAVANASGLADPADPGAPAAAQP